ncbi:MAG: glycosyltransferase family 2 protein [Zoogloeaceae bacterium]|jgi:glycosyltransferase involved in cell wall biosynthesis|nr:glycosyltransferase family 2 protein [Zoogloeaceae bacterium]
MKIAAIIPVFNHEEPVAQVVAALRRHGLPVVLVDDGSAPVCARALDMLASDNAKGPPLVLLRHTENQGKGAAVMTGLAYLASARGRSALGCEEGFSHALQIDADGQHDTAALPEFLRAAAAYPEAVIVGTPQYGADIPKRRLYGRYLTHLWVWINTLSFRIADSMCGFRVYPLAATLPLLPILKHARRMSFDTEILVRLDWQNTPVVSLAVRVRYPENGRSHFRALEDNLWIAAMHARLFLGMLSRSPGLVRRWFQKK